MICKKCQNESPDGSQLCRWCGEPLFPTEEIPRTAMPQADTYRGKYDTPEKKQETVAAVKCPICGALNAADAASCVACGVQFRRPQPAQQKPAEQPMQNSMTEEKTQRRCHLCGKVADGNESFCTACGFPLTSEQKQPEKKEEQILCPFCNQPVRPGSKFCNTCGATVAPNGTAGTGTAQTQTHTSNTQTVTGGSQPVGGPSKEKKGLPVGSKKIALYVGIGAAALIGLILIISLFSSLLGYSGPFTTLASGTKALIDSKSFTAEFSADLDGDEVEGTLELQYNLKKREVTMLIEGSMDGEDFVLAIYDEYLIQGDDDDLYAEDIGDQLDEFFDNLEDAEDEIDPDEIMENLVDSILNAAGDDVFDEDKLETCLKKLVRKLNTAGWLRKNAGYTTKLEKGMTMHVFQPDFAKLLPAALEVLEPAFEDEDDYEDIMDNLEDSEDEMEAVELEFAFGLRFGKLAHIEFDLEIEGEGKFSGEVDFKKIGTTRIDEDHLEDLLDDAER